MKFNDFLKILVLDKKRWDFELGKKINPLFLYFFLREYKIVVRKRFCEYLRTKKSLFFIYCIERFLYRQLTLKNGCDIPSRTKIGPGFVIHHCNGIIINSAAVIGSNFTIRGGGGNWFNSKRYSCYL